MRVERFVIEFPETREYGGEAFDYSKSIVVEVDYSNQEVEITFKNECNWDVFEGLKSVTIKGSK
jgi:hypothetical protein